MTDRSAPRHGSWDDADPYPPPRHGARHSQPDEQYGAYEETVFDRPAYEEPAYGQPAYGQPAYGQASYGQPAPGHAFFGQPAYDAPAFAPPAFDPPPFDPSIAPISSKSSFNGFFVQGGPQGDARPVSPGRPVSPARPVSPVSPAAWNRPVSPGPRMPVSPGPRMPVSPGPRYSGPPAPPHAWDSAGFRDSPGFRDSAAFRDSGRSHWVDGEGIDHRGNLVIDADDVDYDYDRDDTRRRSRVNRRRALLALGGVVGSAAAAMSPQGLALARKLFGGDAEEPDALSKDTLPGNGSDRPAGQQASAARTYSEQNESYMGSSAGDQVRRNTPQQSVVHNNPAQAAQGNQAPQAPAVPQGPPPAPIPVSALGADPIRHLASRVSFGATPKLIADIERMGIDQWLGWQFEPAQIPNTRAEDKLAELTTLGKSIDQLRAERESNDEKGIRPHEEYIEATIARQIWSDRQLFEVMVDFWNDFLHVAAYFDGAEIRRASFDADVIRTYAMDNYPEMFVAANHHPALLTYLDQDQSRVGRVNENLARENLELYTVGVDGGYTELDVRQAALLQTGHRISNDKYFYDQNQHYVGAVTILGVDYANATKEGGAAAAEQYYRTIAMHPSTAHYVALNLCTRLVSDTPPAELVDQVAGVYLANSGKVKPMLATLLSSSAFWQSVGQKVRRPMEYLVATYRTLGVQADTPAGFANNNPNASPFLRGLREIRGKLEQLGHYPTGQPTPDGYPDVHVAWSSAGTMINLWVEALGIVQGDRKMFTYVAPEQILGTTPPAIAGEYVIALGRRLVYQTFTERERDLILSVAGVGANAPVDASFNGAIRAVIRTILASPQHHLR